MTINKYILFLCFSLLNAKSQDVFEYKIKLLGIPVANCLINYTDTTISNVGCKRLDYRVNTNAFIDKIFKINNHYTVIIDTSRYNTLFYAKKSFQPNVINNIKTSLNRDSLTYINSNISINKKDKNIFTVLYLLQSGKYHDLDSINYIEREGKYYKFDLEQYKKNQFKILIEEINSRKNGVIKDTDIFLWGLFLNKSNNRIIMNNEHNYIDKCIFKKGITSITAHYQ